MKSIFTIFLLFIAGFAAAQSIGLGTTAPDASALLDMKSNSKGVLFPRMTVVQRNAIPNPAYGLHVFNTDLNMLEFYDTSTNNWQQYGSCYKLHVTSSVSQIELPAAAYQAYLIEIDPQVVVSGFDSLNMSIGVYFPIPAISLFTTTPNPGATITIVNYGSIRGAGGVGGNGGSRVANAASSPCANNSPTNGSDGGPAIASTNSGVKVLIYNFGVIAGGGGGGGGGKYGAAYGSCGGGGGGGAGANSLPGQGSHPALYNGYYCYPQATTGNAGITGTYTVPGNGGSSTSGGGTGTGGGAPGQAGVTFQLSGYGLPGNGGKAVQYNNGRNIIINANGGVVLGVVD